jgi:hypothetical protein
VTFQAVFAIVAAGVAAAFGPYVKVPPIASVADVKSAMVALAGRSLAAQPRAGPEAPPLPPLPPLELPPLPVVPAVPLVPAVPEPAVPVLPPLSLLQPPTDETLEIMKPAPARPRIPKNALILNSFIVFSP